MERRLHMLEQDLTKMETEMSDFGGIQKVTIKLSTPTTTTMRSYMDVTIGSLETQDRFGFYQEHQESSKHTSITQRLSSQKH